MEGANPPNIQVVGPLQTDGLQTSISANIGTYIAMWR